LGGFCRKVGVSKINILVDYSFECVNEAIKVFKVGNARSHEGKQDFRALLVREFIKGSKDKKHFVYRYCGDKEGDISRTSLFEKVGGQRS